jgi:hypothetical protein
MWPHIDREYGSEPGARQVEGGCCWKGPSSYLRGVHKSVDIAGGGRFLLQNSELFPGETAMAEPTFADYVDLLFTLHALPPRTNIFAYRLEA